MEDLEGLQKMIESGMGELRKRTTEIEETIENRQAFLLDKLAQAKDNEILSAIKAVNNRLDSIEARLPEIEEDAT